MLQVCAARGTLAGFLLDAWTREERVRPICAASTSLHQRHKPRQTRLRVRMNAEQRARKSALLKRLEVGCTNFVESSVYCWRTFLATDR